MLFRRNPKENLTCVVKMKKIFQKKGKRRTLARSLSFSLSVSFTQNRDEKEEEQEDGEEVAIARRKKE